MSSPLDKRYGRGPVRRHGWSHWIPIAIVLTVSTAGLVAWLRNQRRDDEQDHAELEAHLDYGQENDSDDQRNDASGSIKKASGLHGQYDHVRDKSDDEGATPGAGLAARMSGALQSTSNPHELLHSTTRTVAAGVAAAGAAVGKVLASMRDDDKTYTGNSPGSGRADAKLERKAVVPNVERKSIALVISADTNSFDTGDGEFASMLSHIPRRHGSADIKLYILIFAPGLEESELQSISSTALLQAQEPGTSHEAQLKDSASRSGNVTNSESAPPSSSNVAFRAIYLEALTHVDKASRIIPFTTPTGYLYILRHLRPETLYLQESLAGEQGRNIEALQTWMRHDVILVVGTEGGYGGLADSESEVEKGSALEKWWRKTERVGRGRGIVVVDGMRLHEDWIRRVGGEY